MASIRSSILLAVLVLALVGHPALTATLPIGPQQARAAEETTEEPTTTTEEPPPVVETPTEPVTTPEPETPVTTPPVTTPPVGAPAEGGDAPVETPKSTPATGSGSSGGGASGSGGGSGSSSGSGSSGSGSGGATTTSPVTTPTRHTSRTPTHRSTATRNVGGGTIKVDNGAGSAGGGGGNHNTGRTGSGGQSAPSHSGGGPAPQPTVSPQAIDEGASAVSKVASHVGEAFAEALPTAPLKKIGDQVAAHIAGTGTAPGGKDRRQDVEGIGKALGAALIGSAVAVHRPPAASNGPIPFFDPSGGKSGTIYLVLIVLLLLGVGALVFRETRAALGLDAPRTGVRVADEKPRIALRERVGLALAGLHEATGRWFGRFRRLRANAAAGLRSLF